MAEAWRISEAVDGINCSYHQRDWKGLRESAEYLADLLREDEAEDEAEDEEKQVLICQSQEIAECLIGQYVELRDGSIVRISGLRGVSTMEFIMSINEVGINDVYVKRHRAGSLCSRDVMRTCEPPDDRAAQLSARDRLQEAYARKAVLDRRIAEAQQELEPLMETIADLHRRAGE